MGLILLCDTDLGKRVETGPVGTTVDRLLDEAFDVGEAKDRSQARARNAPVRALALPVRDADELEALDGLGSRRGVEPRQRQGVERGRRPDPLIARSGLRPRLRERRFRRPVEDDLLSVSG